MVRTAKTRQAVFLDRDGVLTIPRFQDGRSYAPRSLDEFAVYPEAASALDALRTAGFALVVVSNQPDVGENRVARAVVEEMNRRLAGLLPLDGIYCCFHGRNEGCDCRKPRPGLLLQAARELGIDAAASFMVGDRAGDMRAGRAVGATTVFIDLHYVNEERPEAPDAIVPDIAAATAFILGSPLSAGV